MRDIVQCFIEGGGGVGEVCNEVCLTEKEAGEQVSKLFVHRFSSFQYVGMRNWAIGDRLWVLMMPINGYKIDINQ